jgi:hypothetical protein
MPTRSCRALSLLALATLLGWAAPARAMLFDVPGTHPTIQAAVAAAAASPDVDNTITLSISPIHTNVAIVIGGAFGPARHLTIQPAAGFDRITVASGNPNVAIFELTSCGNVIIRDLDILKNITNNNHLVILATCENVTIERCRIGSNHPTPGLAGWSNVQLFYPTEVILRNNILFALYPGTLDRGIYAQNFNDPANSLRLYNNVVSDHKIYGIHIEAGIPGPLVLLRNNVVVNHTSFVAEPVAYRSNVAIGGPTVVASHNTAFASIGFDKSIPGGNQDIAGLTSFLRFDRLDVIPAFQTRDWTFGPPFDVNLDFYRLTPGGPLHMDAGQYGFNVPAMLPDVAVVDDIEKDPRPGGIGPHTDRGADQIATEPVSGVENPAAPGIVLQASARSNPSSSLVVNFRSARPGRITLEVFDPSGRRLFRTERNIGAGDGSLAAPHPGAQGVVIYRLLLEPVTGAPEVVSGKVVLLR